MSEYKWNFWGTIISASIAAAASIYSISLSAKLSRSDDKIDELLNNHKKWKNVVDSLLSENQILKNKLNAFPKDSFQPVQGQKSGTLPNIGNGAYQLKPSGPLVGDRNTGIVTLKFDLINTVEDSQVSLFTSESHILGNDNNIYDAEAAKIANSRIARPHSNTSWTNIYKGYALAGYVSFKADVSVSSVNVIKIKISDTDLTLRGNYLIEWQ